MYFKEDPAVEVEGVHELVLVDKFLVGVAQFDVGVLRLV